MDALAQLRGAIPDAAKDIRLNLQVRIAATVYAAAVALEAGAEAVSAPGI